MQVHLIYNVCEVCHSLNSAVLERYHCTYID